MENDWHSTKGSWYACACTSWPVYVRINSTMYFDTEFHVKYITRRQLGLSQIVMHKPYFVDFGWQEAWTFAITYQVRVWEQSTASAAWHFSCCNNIVPPNDSGLVAFCRSIWSSLILTSNHAFYFRHNLCGASCCSPVFTVYRQTDCHKNRGYRDFLGGLAAFFFTAWL